MQGRNVEELLMTARGKGKALSKALEMVGVYIFEYDRHADRLVIYDSEKAGPRQIDHYLEDQNTNTVVHPEERWKVTEFFQGRLSGPLEFRVQEEDGGCRRVLVQALPLSGDGKEDTCVLVGCIKDVTQEKKREQILEERAMRDSLTGLYNIYAGKELVNEYLHNKNPYASCGIMVMDIDYFKTVNDRFGHLFGDTVLKKFAEFLRMTFSPKDILIRAGGDEFVVLLRDISHTMLVKKASQLVETAREIQFEEQDYSLTCSLGVCYLPENISGFTYNQLFANADWALYSAKNNGRNRYAFCDNLQRYRETHTTVDVNVPGVDARYLHNDIISTAFEIFEKTSAFGAAMNLLLEVIGIRFQLDRISVIRTDIAGRNVTRQYQWRLGATPEVLTGMEGFEKEDFLTLFRSYDEYGTTVLQYDNMGMYSEAGAALLMQGDAKTVVYAAMYCDGKYTGAISFVVCREKRFWTKEDRSQLGELTRIISAHLARNLAVNASNRSWTAEPGYDTLTGLLSFTRFREEVERVIVGNDNTVYVMTYTDFVNFKYFNHKYGFQTGDQLLQDFSKFIIENLKIIAEVYFTRVTADKFILFTPYDPSLDIESVVEELNRQFITEQMKKYPSSRIHMRSGIYMVGPECNSASAAIDAANFARRHCQDFGSSSVKFYDEELGRIQQLEMEIMNNMGEILQKKQFKVYLQPRFSMRELKVVGAEALVRWEREDGSILYPDSFIPYYEKNGRILELDMQVFEQVVAFLAKNKALGRKQYPISVNASILHATDGETVDRYLEILNRYGVEPDLVEVELTETATISDYDSVKRWFRQLQDVHIRTVLDDFGAGFSILNTVIDIPFNTLKLDKEFINLCVPSRKGIYFLEHLVGMIKGLGCHVICEGIETKEQVEALRSIGCEEGQGFFFARPMSVEAYEKMVYGEPDPAPQETPSPAKEA